MKSDNVNHSMKKQLLNLQDYKKLKVRTRSILLVFQTSVFYRILVLNYLADALALKGVSVQDGFSE